MILKTKEATLCQPSGSLGEQKGITLIETLVLMMVVVVLVVSVYIGVVFAEKQLLLNYRDRVATLLVAGELDMEYYRHSKSKPFELQANRTYVLDDLDNKTKLKGTMSIKLNRAQESSNEKVLDYIYLEATLKWLDTVSNKERFVRMREDYFI